MRLEALASSALDQEREIQAMRAQLAELEARLATIETLPGVGTRK